MKLSGVIAVEQNAKAKGGNSLTGAYHKAQKSALFSGLLRTYKPLSEDGEKFPQEKKLVQVRVSELINEVTGDLADWVNITLTKDKGNCLAKADIVIDGTVLVANVPATNLLFLEKKLVDIKTFVDSLPVLDPSEEWVWDSNTSQYKSEVTQTSKTKKIQRGIVLHPPTVEHPAQTAMITEDVMVGNWEQQSLSGAIQKQEKDIMLVKLEKLQRAVKLAREEANSTDVTKEVAAGPALVNFLFSK
jgi:hypothetical protein